MNYNRHNINTKSPAATLPFRDQDFYKLREACLKQQILFEDPYFKYEPKYYWRRPHEICNDPHIYIDGVSRHDINQGTLGDCWLLAGMSALAMQFDLVRRVIPEDQSFQNQYAGIFHFRLWQFGKWYDVVIDDRLPTDQSGNMCFLHSKAKNEFWTALLEKAYCKMAGGFYKVAEAGNLCEGIEDFTGGVVEQFNVPSAPKNFDRILLKSFTKRSLMGCFMDASPEEIENKRPDGLMKGHSYTITCVINIDLQPHGRITLIRIRNPWGQVEFNGPWSDGSPEWQNVSDDIKRKIGLVYENDGEFWMSYSYFCTNCWDWVDMCHLNPDAYDHDDNKKLDWYMNAFQGSWITGLTNGSNTNMAINPQVRLTLTEADDEDEDGVCTVLIALLQKAKGPERFDYNDIAVAVYKIDDPQYLQYPLDQYFFQRNMPICQTLDRATREVAGRFNLAPGNYCLVPFTFSGKEGDFLLRVYTEKTHDMNELGDRIGLKPTDIRPNSVQPFRTMSGKRHNVKTRTQKATLAFRGQNFHELRNSCLKQKILFEDPYFKTESKYQWKRPHDICDDPKLFVGGASRHDIVQGALGDCWLLAGMASLAMQFDLVRRVIPEDQSFVDNYAGIFHFRLWQFGKWYDVVIDDRLPVAANGKLAFLHSKQENEFWVALLEKAYCKLVGGFYKVAEAGNLCEGLEDFTGGVVEQFHVPSAPKNFDRILLKSYEKRSLMGCFIDAHPNEIELKRPDGLMKGHSYSITSARAINIQPHGNITLIRIRNPWGQAEWKGAWSDGSAEWKNVAKDLKQDLGLVYENDGEFWMSYSDFMSCWNWVDMCHLTPDIFEHDKDKVLDWHMNAMKGSWVKNLSDGGKKNMHLNPQVRMTLSSSDDEDEDGFCSILVALLQRAKGPERFNYNEIGVAIYKTDQSKNKKEPLDKYFFRRNKPVAKTSIRATREVAGRFNLLPGEYCLIPYTYYEGREGDFVLRVFTEKKPEIDEVDEKIGMKPKNVHQLLDVNLEKEEESDDENKMKDNKLKEFFDKTTGKDAEADWHELKNILDFAVKNEKTLLNNHERHFLLDMITHVLDFISRPPPYHSAFETLEARAFPKELCRSMIALLDMDHSGKLNYIEFRDLWSGILKWKSIYEAYSNESGGILTSSQLKKALHVEGFELNQRLISDLVHRYANKEGNISFDDFLHCALKLSFMSDYFQSKENEKNDKAEFTLQEFISKTLYS